MKSPPSVTAMSTSSGKYGSAFGAVAGVTSPCTLVSSMRCEILRSVRVVVQRHVAPANGVTAVVEPLLSWLRSHVSQSAVQAIGSSIPGLHAPSSFTSANAQQRPEGAGALCVSVPTLHTDAEHVSVSGNAFVASGVGHTAIAGPARSVSESTTESRGIVVLAIIRGTFPQTRLACQADFRPRCPRLAVLR